MEKVKLIGWFLLFFGFFSIISNFIYDDPANILWFCYVGMVLMGIGILFKKAWLIETQLNILLIPIILWVLDFFFFLFIGEPLFGITDYFFAERSLLFQIISLEHFFSVPLGLYSLSKIKKKPIKLSWLFSIIQLIIIFILTRVIDVNEVNVNWVFENYTPFNFGQFYIINWFVITIIFTLLGYFLICKFVKYPLSPNDRESLKTTKD